MTKQVGTKGVRERSQQFTKCLFDLGEFLAELLEIITVRAQKCDGKTRVKSVNLQQSLNGRRRTVGERQSQKRVTLEGGL